MRCFANVTEVAQQQSGQLVYLQPPTTHYKWINHSPGTADVHDSPHRHVRVESQQLHSYILCKSNLCSQSYWVQWKWSCKVFYLSFFFPKIQTWVSILSRTDRIMLRTENDKCRNTWSKVLTVILKGDEYVLWFQKNFFLLFSFCI